MPLDPESSDDSQENLDVEMDLGDEEYIPTQSTVKVVKAKSGHSTNDIPVTIPSEDVIVIDNDNEIPVRRSTRKTRKPKPMVTAQPYVSKTNEKRKVRLYH